MSKVFVFAPSLYCLLHDMNYKRTNFTQIYCDTQYYCGNSALDADYTFFEVAI